MLNELVLCYDWQKASRRTSVHLEVQPPVQSKYRKDNDRTASALGTHNFSILNSNLNINKSAGPDNISSKLLRIAGNAIVPAITGLYQFSCESKSVFSAWKIARLTPIYKKMTKLNEEITAQSPYSAFQARSWSR